MVVEETCNRISSGLVERIALRDELVTQAEAPVCAFLHSANTRLSCEFGASGLGRQSSIPGFAERPEAGFAFFEGFVG